MSPIEWLLAVGAALLVVWAVAVAVLLALRPRDVRLGELVRVVPDVVRLGRRLVTDATVPMPARLGIVALLAWLLNPVDLIPEFVPVLGPLDDIVVAVLVLRHVRRHVGDEGLRARWPGTDDGFALLLSVLRGPRAGRED